MLVKVPALPALRRSYLAHFHGDAETTVTFASGPWPSSARPTAPTPSPGRQAVRDPGSERGFLQLKAGTPVMAGP